MAERKIPFLSDVDGKPEEFDVADVAVVGGLRTTTAAGIALGGAKATGAADPTDPQDLATKAYVDANANIFDVDVILTDLSGSVLVDLDGNVLREI